MGRGWQQGARGQRGFTLIEALLAVIIVSIAVITIAGGLLVSSRVDNNTNERQRANLALTTFTENMTYVSPGGSPCGIGSGAPVSSSAVTNPPSHAELLLDRALAADEVQDWIDRGMMFRITSVTYASGNTGPGLEAFSAACPAPPTDPDAPVYPVIKVKVTACRAASASATACPPDTMVVSSDVVRRGGRSGS